MPSLYILISENRNKFHIWKNTCWLNFCECAITCKLNVRTHRHMQQQQPPGGLCGGPFPLPVSCCWRRPEMSQAPGESLLALTHIQTHTQQRNVFFPCCGVWKGHVAFFSNVTASEVHRLNALLMTVNSVVAWLHLSVDLSYLKLSLDFKMELTSLL